MKDIRTIDPRRSFVAISVLTAAALLFSACGSTGGDTASGQAAEDDATLAEPDTDPAVGTSATTVESDPNPTSTAAATALTTDSPAFSESSDIVYMTIDVVELSMDVFTPPGDGPWPVVVSFHGLGNEGKDMMETAAVAEAAAAEEMVVFTPTWIAGNPFPITSKTFETWDNTVSCAIAFAQENASEYGGDPTKTVVDGFSAGAGAALLFASQDPRVEPILGCETDQLPTPVAGFVLGDVEAWLHSENFDDAFASESEAIQARLAALIGPRSWEHGADAEFHLWVSEKGTTPRTIGEPSDDSGWFAQRDPDGSIQADLERLDQFADGVVDQVDAGQLLNLRLEDAGIETTLDLYPGGHTTLDKVPEIVAYLQAAASR